VTQQHGHNELVNFAQDINTLATTAHENTVVEIEQFSRLSAECKHRL